MIPPNLCLTEVGHHCQPVLICGCEETTKIFDIHRIGEGPSVVPESGFRSCLGLLRNQTAEFPLCPLGAQGSVGVAAVEGLL